MDELFIEALREENISKIKGIPKSDLHNHGVYGGNKEYIGKLLNKEIKVIDGNQKDIAAMSQWITGQIFPEMKNRAGFMNLLGGAFENAREDGVVKLEMSIDIGWIESYYKDEIELFYEDINKLIKRYSDNIDIVPEMGIKWESDIIELNNNVERHFTKGFFKAIDLYGNEKCQSVDNFIPIFKEGKRRGMKLKAHVGEFGSHEDITEVVDKLDITAVQHGISAHKSEECMKYLREKNVTLNICPTSNVLLGRVKGITEHPIRRLFDNGVSVTINSDDILIFDSTVSEEYLKLYRAGLFTPQELNKIRQNGLKQG